MGRFKATSGEGAADGESGSWVGALSQVLDKLGISGKPEAELAHIGPEIEVEVTDSVTGAQIAVSTLGVHVEEASEFGGDDDSTEVVEPPSLARSAVFAQREEDGEAALAHVVAQCGQIASAVSIEAACNVALDILIAAVPAESASVLLVEGESLRFACVRGPRAEALLGTTMPADEGIAGVVLSRGKGLVVREAGRSGTHYGEVDKMVEYHTRTVLAVPMVADSGVVGVLELLNPFGSADFAEWHQRAAVRVGRRIAKRLSAG